MPKPSRIPLRAAAPQEAGTAPSKPIRRTFTAAEKLRVVDEADACTERGQVEALLRREGLYASHLAKWRAALRLHGERGLQARKPGPASTRDVRDEQLSVLSRENQRLRAKLERAEAIIDLQKKVSVLLGIELRTQES